MARVRSLVLFLVVSESFWAGKGSNIIVLTFTSRTIIHAAVKTCFLSSSDDV